MNIRTIINSLSILSLLLFSSCRGVDRGIEGVDHELGGVANIKFKITGLDYENHMNFQAGLKSYLGNEKQYNVVKFSNNINMLVEVQPMSGLQNNLQSSGQNILYAKSSINNLAAGVYYRVIVYDKDTKKHVTTQTYIVGNEATAAPMKLNAGKEYIFVAYSYGETTFFTNSPVHSDLDTDYLTLSLSIANTNKLLYFRKDDVGPLAANNTININFKPRTAYIGFRLNSDAGNITAISNVLVSPHYQQSNLSLSTGNVITQGSPSDVPVTFSNLNAKSITSSYHYLNVGSGSILGRLRIGSMTMNGVTKTDIDIKNINIKPGFSYWINITFKPSGDIIVDPETVLIDGRLWKRHNNGADTSIDPDKTSFDVRATGNYYQWGDPSPLANGTTMLRQIDWRQNQVPMPNGSWVEGIKNNNDPCPAGFRVPTLAEVLSLNTSMNILGPVQGVSAENSSGIFTSIAGKVLVSKNNPNVKLTFPTAGYIYVGLSADRRNGDRISVIPNNQVSYLVSTVVPNDANSAYVMTFSQGTTGVGRANNVRTMGNLLRCIGEK